MPLASTADIVRENAISTPVTVKSCPDGYQRHPNGGGLVATTARVAPSAYVALGARVEDFAVLCTSARLFDDASVGGFAVIGSMVTLRDNARVEGKAILRGGGIVREHGYVGGHAYLFGPVVVTGRARAVDVELRGRFHLS
jgi:UDP-3-O-[3-hydroxymyristoyl] glucosamine N-acyltransferase